MLSSAFRNRGWAAAMSGVWNAPPTATSVTARGAQFLGHIGSPVGFRRAAGYDAVTGRVGIGEPDVTVGPLSRRYVPARRLSPISTT